VRPAHTPRSRPALTHRRRYRAGLVFKRSALSHDQVPQYYFQQLLQTLPAST
jgi:hypothetical protein